MGPQILLAEGALQPRLLRPLQDEQRRAECLQMALKWTGAKLDAGEYERADVNTADNRKSTCLHYSAAGGMKICVEVRARVKGQGVPANSRQKKDKIDKNCLSVDI